MDHEVGSHPSKKIPALNMVYDLNCCGLKACKNKYYGGKMMLQNKNK